MTSVSAWGTVVYFLSGNKSHKAGRVQCMLAPVPVTVFDPSVNITISNDLSFWGNDINPIFWMLILKFLRKKYFGVLLHLQWESGVNISSCNTH